MLAGRGLTFAFTRGGADTTKLMNVVNLPMHSSSVVRKMTSTQKDAEQSAAAQCRGTRTAEVGLIVKKHLAGVGGLDIKLKDSELKKLRLSDTGRA